jgi:serine/threonine protein kinase/Tfp pilus assembly protein PilF
MPFNLGEAIGPYRIIEQLGQGGMATVYKAYHANLDRFVAIKVLHPSFKDDESFYIRFQREAQVVAKMEHPHIVPVYDFATEGAEPYIVMKFIEGQTLKHRMKRKQLTLDETLRIIEAVAAALDYAHAQGVIHRDIKPSNVMMEKDEIPYLTDFGLARIATSGESTMSQDVLIGTPNYISPEQARGDKRLGPATDIYSLGIMLYEIVVGRVPFSADTPYAVVHDHIYKPLPLPTYVNPTVPKEVEIVLLKALAKSPEDRYATASDLVVAFKGAITASHMSELSATSLRIERLSSPSSSEMPTPTTADLQSIVKAAVADALASEQRGSSQTGPAIPGVIPSSYITTPPPYWQARRRAGRGFWIVSGIAALVFICIASLAVMIRANQNEIVQSNPALALDEDALPSIEPIEPIRDEFVVPDMSLAEAEIWATNEPDKPVAILTLAMQQYQAGMLEEAFANMLRLSNNPDAPGELLARAAREVSTLGLDDLAARLWLAAYDRTPDDVEIRNEAGQYLYHQLDGMTLTELNNFRETAVPNPESPLAKTMLAHAILTNSRLLTAARQDEVQSLLDEVLAANEDFAEAHLIYGNYYARLREFDQAIESWRFAASFPDAPQWVQQEARLKINRTPAN